MRLNRFRSGRRKAGFTQMIRAAGSNGIAGIIWAAAFRRKTRGRSSAGRPWFGTLRRSRINAGQATLPAIRASARHCCIGHTTAVRYNKSMQNTGSWYANLIKPTWAPPSWLFGPVWSVLYTLIIISFGAVFYNAITKKIPVLVALPFVLNIVFNLAFSPIQFSLQNNWLAAIDILLVLATLIWAMVAIYPYMKWVAWINIPYLVWVSFATVLQLTITYLNK